MPATGSGSAAGNACGVEKLLSTDYNFPPGWGGAMKYITTIDDHEYTIEILDERHILVDGVEHETNLESVGGQPIYSLIVGGRSFEVHVYPAENGYQVLVHGNLYQARVEDERERRLRAALVEIVPENREFHLKAPMPGLVVAVPVSEGQAIEKGDVLLILESMKMQNELKSPRAGKISRVRVKAGDSVEHKQTLLSVI
jgi:biotin carboxyl carrier protein